MAMLMIKTLLSKTVPNRIRYSATAASVLKAGDILRQTRAFTVEDVTQYSKVCYGLNPHHFDSEFNRKAGFDDRVVHGMLVAALFPRIIPSHFPGAVYASQSLHFKSPVYVGDEVTGEVEAIKIYSKILNKVLQDGCSGSEWRGYGCLTDSSCQDRSIHG